ncbi:restriction endonuclease subunit S, partial [Clostridium butyricum]|nr:restriction endonuclease subunit S [Clostridium butyricum]
MNKNKEKVPKIRFPGFTEPWEQRKFDEIFTMLQNNALSRADLNSEQGSAMNVHYGDILIKFGECLDVSKEKIPFITDDTCLTKYKESFLVNGDVIIADAAEDEAVGKCSEIVGLTTETVISGLHTIPCRANKVFANGYLGYYMNSNAYHNQLLPLIQGTKVSSISKTALKDTIVLYPKSTEEQALISQYFTKLNNLITLHQRKLNHLKDKKKGLLQKMFPKKGELVPELRFPEFTDTWEQRKLGEVAVRVTRKNKDLESTLPLTISAQDGLIDQNEFFNKTVASRDVSGYYLVKNGEFAYNKSYSNGYPWGNVINLSLYKL